MKTKFFHATEKGTFAGKPAGELQRFLRDYVLVVVPESSIDDWRVNDHFANAQNLGPKSILPSHLESGDARLHHAACYVREGCESEVLEVNFVLQDGTLVNLMSAKCWAAREVAWQVADAVERALTSVFAWEEIPAIVGMFRKLPRKASYSVESSLEGEVTVSFSATSVELRLADGSLCDSADFSGQPSPHLAVSAYVTDWIRVLGVAGVGHVLKQETAATLPEAA